MSDPEPRQPGVNPGESRPFRGREDVKPGNIIVCKDEGCLIGRAQALTVERYDEAIPGETWKAPAKKVAKGNQSKLGGA